MLDEYIKEKQAEEINKKKEEEKQGLRCKLKTNVIKSHCVQFAASTGLMRL